MKVDLHVKTVLSLSLATLGVGDHRVPRPIGEDRGRVIASVHRSPPAPPAPIWAPLPVWGVTAYDPLAPWVVVEDHAGEQRLQRLGEGAAQDAE
ncbi:hypothetical protein WMF31_33350 [Sorangium sp. So ce1036]|uniref:hypothetical protein n=1 Tax=Sorangium sp. So ce1036 TaxID=3133328 RepID=UPI003F031DAF